MKFYGKIGYDVEPVETSPGVWEESIVEKNYYGDWMRHTRSIQDHQKVNDDLEISNTLSIVADPFAVQNFYQMRYVEYQGVKWKVTSVELQFPRLVLSIGGLYHGG